jgi:bifunctional ADP-heptose synthase (sugar kinase/adenylyltransferase)
MNFLVIGESCTDVYVYCNCERLCPEAPVPVLDVIETNSASGMAGNTFRNLQQLTKDCALITNDNFDSIKKSRFVEAKTNHMFIRIDTKGKYNRIDLEANRESIEKADCIIISDYNKGFLHEDDIEQIGKMCKNVFLDTKKRLGEWAKTVKFIKINRKEFLESESEIRELQLDNKIIKTLGPQGAVTMWNCKIFPVVEVEVKDLSGAGDTFAAALAYQYMKTNNIDEAVEYANKCATSVVQKRGTSII